MFKDGALASVENSDKTRVERTATSRPDTNAPKRQRGPRKRGISSRFRLDIFVLFLFFIPFAPHEPAKPSPMYYHDSPPRCGCEQCITQATEPRDFASTTSKHLKAISRYKTYPMTRHDFMDAITVLLTLCAPGRNVAVCSLRVFALFCTETKPLFSKTSCFLAFSPGLPTFLHVFSQFLSIKSDTILPHVLPRFTALAWYQIAAAHGGRPRLILICKNSEKNMQNRRVPLRKRE